MANNELVIYTDGSSRGNPGPGGYGTILFWGGHRKELSQGYRRTTNNRMELMAVIAGLEALKKDGLTITIYSDSQYVVKAVEQGWLKNWIATDFKGGKKIKTSGSASMSSQRKTNYALSGSAVMPTIPTTTVAMSLPRAQPTPRPSMWISSSKMSQ